MILPGLVDGEKILAVVVTYQPDETLERNLRALRNQSESVLVVDNGSTNSSEVAKVAKATGCRTIFNPTNLGIATAFNQGIAVAANEGFSWVITFDQDSLAPSGLLAGLLNLYRCHPARDLIGVIAPTHRDRATGEGYHQPGDRLVEHDDWRVVRSCISSGSLVPIAVYLKVGVMDEKLFIDCVDHDFCMRCRDNGFLVVESTREILEHSMGAATTRMVFGKPLVFSNHSAERHYYMTRNQLEIYRRCVRIDFYWVIKGFFFQMVTCVLVLLFEEHRSAKLRAMLDGLKDFVLRRFGPRRL